MDAGGELSNLSDHTNYKKYLVKNNIIDNNVYDFLSRFPISFLQAISIYIKIHSATYNHKKH